MTPDQMAELAARLRDFGKAYPVEIFPEITNAERAEHGRLITRAAAQMGRHFAKFAVPAADLIESMAQAKPSRSERLREAGFTPRDKRIACDECGQLVSQQFLPIHKCEQRGEPVAWKAGGYLFFHRDEIPGDLLPPRQPEPQPLYTAPPAREPLSDEQIYQAMDAARESYRAHTTRIRGQMLTVYDDMDWHLARAIEQAVWEKNDD